MYIPSDDTFLMLESAKKHAKGSVLEMGCGTGIISKELCNLGFSVLAADIDKSSVEHCKKQGINALQSNLFQNIKQKFDCIIFNPPYLPKDPEDNDPALYDTGIIRKFLEQAETHLNKDGILLLTWSSLNNYKPLLKKLNYIFKTIASKKLAFETLEILECSKPNNKKPES